MNDIHEKPLHERLSLCADEMEQSDVTMPGYVALFRIASETITTQQKYITELEAGLEKVYSAGLSGIGHVSAANYPERERAAIRNLQKAYDEARRLLAETEGTE